MRTQKIKICFLALLQCVLLCLNIPVFGDVPNVLPDAEPVVQIAGYEMQEGNIELDSSFTIKIILKNNNAYAAAYNVVADVATSDVRLQLKNAEVSQRYFECVPAGGQVSFTQSFVIDKEYPLNHAILTYNLRYTSESGKEYSNTSYISPGLKKTCKLSVNSISVSENANVGARTIINVKCENVGVVNMSKLSMVLEGNVADNQTSIYLGEIPPGEIINKDVYVTFLKEGTQELKISFEYTDDFGDKYTYEPSFFTVNVNKKKSVGIASSNSSGINIGGQNFSIKMILFTIMSIVGIIYLITKLLDSMKRGGGK